MKSEHSPHETTGGAEAVAAYLSAVPAWYLATEEAGQPHVRPFSFAEAKAGRLWFCTARTKDVFAELQANPRFEACAWQPGSGWLILQGRAAFGEPDAELRRHGYEHLSGLGESYEGPDDPALAFFFVSCGRAELRDIDGSKRLIWES